MASCASPACDGPATIQGKFSMWCDDHGTLLAEVRKSMRGKSGPRPVKRKLTAAEKTALIESNALKLARAAVEQPGRPDGPKLLGLGWESDAYQDAVTFAKRRGWLTLSNHSHIHPGGVAPPAEVEAKAEPVRPRGTLAHDRALALARAVHAAGWLSGDAVAEVAGCQSTPLRRATRIAREAGWIECGRGRPGYSAGEIAPPAA